MNRRNLFKNLSLLGLIPLSRKISIASGANIAALPENEREFWIDVLTRIADPLLNSLSQGKLKQLMPVECIPGSEENRKRVTYLEAFGRLMAGISPMAGTGRR